MRFRAASLALVLVLGAAFGTVSGYASEITFGDMDCLGQGCYGAMSPTAGATLEGLAAGAITFATLHFLHGYPFTPSAGDFPGTDTIFVGNTQTGAHDGYSVSSGRVSGPQVFTLDYSSLIGPGQSLSSLTLGIAADDFQFPDFGQPFTAMVNGSINAALITDLQTLSESGPVVQFFTLGLNPTIDTSSHILTLSIDEGGDGGDGWAVDFLTIGATTTSAPGPAPVPTPEPSAMAMLTIGLFGMAAAARRLTK